MRLQSSSCKQAFAFSIADQGHDRTHWRRSVEGEGYSDVLFHDLGWHPLFKALGVGMFTAILGSAT